MPNRYSVATSAKNALEIAERKNLAPLRKFVVSPRRMRSRTNALGSVLTETH